MSLSLEDLKGELRETYLRTEEVLLAAVALNLGTQPQNIDTLDPLDL